MARIDRDKKHLHRLQRGEKRKKAKRVEKKESAASEFDRLLSGIEEQEIRGQLDAVLATIEKKSQELKDQLTERKLQEYAGLVRDFLSLVNEEYLSTRELVSRGRDGRIRVLKTVEKINLELEELRSIVLTRESSWMKVMERIDRIRGLLLDIYS